jgi:hypothetical protein
MLISENKSTGRICCLNWPELFPYKPDVKFDIWHTSDELHIVYHVQEDAVRAECANDRDHAWEDSCAEFFFEPRADGRYYNVESTCIGKIYMCCGPDRISRTFLPDGAYMGIRRISSLGSVPFGLKSGPVEWSLRLDIPASTFGLETFRGLRAKGNFYKCGDKLPVRHFLSWAPVNTPRPDFHRPEFFDELNFE